MNLIYQNSSAFVSWPQRSLLLLSGVSREIQYHKYTANVRKLLLDVGITPGGWNNGPAICSFLLAGSVRPLRETGRGRNIHHIYDGKFPYANKVVTTHAAKDGRYFAETAGLVALHPLADAIVDEFAEFAWWLQRGLQ